MTSRLFLSIAFVPCSQVARLRAEKDEAREELETLALRLTEEKHLHDAARNERDQADAKAAELKRAYEHLESELYEKMVAVERLEAALREVKSARDELQKEKDTLNLSRDERDRLLEEEVRRAREGVAWPS